MVVFKPGVYATPPRLRSVFLAGSIEMGQAEDWQLAATERIAASGQFDQVYNPRRDDWDATWAQELTNPEFYKQVTWELEHLETATDVFFYFAPGTKSPITLLELGLTAKFNSRIIVVCPDGFWRKGNVDIVCSRLGYPVYKTLDEGLDALLF